jgi:hypothetical protein
VKFSLYRDGADNWFIEGEQTTRARLVMEVSIPRAAFGGDFGNPSRAELIPIAALPPNVAASAALVSQRIGINARTVPREVVAKLVTYFRSFQDSDDPPAGRTDIYLDLALAQKGVCRHRAFAFLVTALHNGIPTRMVSNEAHAWVEVHDGRLWRRIDLGGAGRTLHDPLSTNVSYEPPPDPFSWPQGSQSGNDLADRARRAGGGSSGAPPGASSADPRAPGSATAAASAGGNGGGASGGTGASGGFGSFGASGGASGQGGFSGQGGRPGAPAGPDDRPASTLSMSVAAPDAHRGAPLRIKGQVASDGEPCGHVPVEIVLRSKTHGDIPIGLLATDERGNYDGALVLPPTVPLGDYEAHARTYGDQRCGKGQTR